MKENYEQEKIRNFSIIAHIDHGKSTLADRFLELTGSDHFKYKKSDRITDTLEIEQEKGITIKLQVARIPWKGHLLNLIDTPGHVDFSYEVSRSLAACESAILLIDAQQGIQAQTISNTQKAIDVGLKLIPVLNKIDLPGVNIEKKLKEIEAYLGFKKDEVILVSGRTGENADKLLDEIVKQPAPKGIEKANFRGLIFDSFYDEHRGVVLSVRVFDGEITKNVELLHLIRKKENFKPTEIGIFLPQMQKVDDLKTGEVGYIATGLKDIRYFTVGDTISTKPDEKPFDGYKVPKPNVFATFFPTNPEDYENLKIGLNKLSLNDGALSFVEQKSSLLGAGFRCGFLGLLHMEIIQERLEREYDIDLIITAPTVAYKIVTTSDEEITIETPQEMPDPSAIKEISEPWVRVKIFTPQEYMGNIMTLCKEKRGEYVNTTFLGKENTIITEQFMQIEFDMPLASLISNFFDSMKNLSRGYASMEYELIDFFPANIVKVSVLVNKEEVSALNFLEIREGAQKKASKLLSIMKTVIPKQQFQIPLQAAIGGKVIAREDVKSLRKNVTEDLYGGDYSRKKKLLQKQKKGKKRLKQIGKVNIPQDAFLAILKT
jgi:GTP-binding protein LepA